MRKFLVLLLTLLMMTVVAVSCNKENVTADTTDSASETVAAIESATEAAAEKQTTASTAATSDLTTEAVTEAATEAATEALSETSSEEDEIILPSETEPTPTETSAPVEVPYDPIENPVIFSGDKTIEGYHASGEFNFENGDACSSQVNNMFIVTNDRMSSGRLTATFTAPAQDNNDNGIIFGMEDDAWEQYYFWEDGPSYYFLFVSDAEHLYLAKVSYNGTAWTILHVTDAPIPNYHHGDEITISVEFDGEGCIDCYANGEWLISYYDFNYLEGDRYGIRCEVPGVSYSNVVAEPGWTP